MQDQAPPPGVIEYLLLALGGLGTWLTGETGRILIAGGLGGLTRWLLAQTSSPTTWPLDAVSGRQRPVHSGRSSSRARASACVRL